MLCATVLAIKRHVVAATDALFSSVAVPAPLMKFILGRKPKRLSNTVRLLKRSIVVIANRIQPPAMTMSYPQREMTEQTLLSLGLAS